MGIKTSSLGDGHNGDENHLDSSKVRTIRFGNGECEKLVNFNTSVLDPDSSKKEYEAAVRLQKVYKSFRTRRKLADCAILVEQGWWKVMDFLELEKSSLLFFDNDKQESAISRWSRAKTKAAKVGKGLSKNSKARKLALQHWLEAIDPRHRYGHNLHFYYIKWLETQSKQPFFYWLDVGEGKKVNLARCPRSKLQQQCVQYLGPLERQAYEVVLHDGKFHYKQTGELIHTVGDDINAKWIFVLSTSKALFVGKKKKGRFQHSSFLAGGVTVAAGRLVVEQGNLKAVWPHSGHYQPTDENFQDFLAFLRENNVDLTDVKTSSAEEGEEELTNSHHQRMGSSDMDVTEALHSITMMEGVEEDLVEEESNEAEQKPEIYGAKQETESHDSEQTENCNKDNGQKPSASTEEEVEENYLGTKQELREEEVTVSRDSILKRISSKRETGSYQLGKQLSCRWTTGAGPRIGCVRDYPSEMQCKALEQLNLSPKKNPNLFERDRN